MEETPDHTPQYTSGSTSDLRYHTRVFTQTLHAAPRTLILTSTLFFAAAYFAIHFPDVPGASAASYASTFLIALPSLMGLFGYLGIRGATLSLLTLAAFGYTIEAIGAATGFPYGSFYYGDALGEKALGLVPYLLPISYAPLVIGATAASWNSSLILNYRFFTHLPGRPSPHPDGRGPRSRGRFFGFLDLA